MAKQFWALQFLPLIVLAFIATTGDVADAKHHISLHDQDNENKTKLEVTIKHEKPKSTEGQQEGESDEATEALLEIILTEGQPGWKNRVEKMAKKNKNNNQDKDHKQDSTDQGPEAENPSRRSGSGDPHRTEDSTKRLAEPPTGAIDTLKGYLSTMGDKANRAKNGISEMIDNWGQKSNDDRNSITSALNTAAAQIPKFANAKDDPVSAIAAAVSMGASFVSLAGPTGALVSVAMNFIAGILSLFGKGPKKKSVGEIVREQIDEALEVFYDKTLSDEAQAAVNAMRHSKSFLDGVASTGDMISDSEANSLSSHVPVYYGVEFMSKLSVVIRRLVQENKAKDAKKCLKYIELYCQLAALKDMALQQFASLLPDSHKNIRAGVYGMMDALRDGQAVLFEFLYKSDLGNKIMPYFDPDFSIISDVYLDKVLKIRNYDRWLAGTYCFTPGGQTKSMTWSSEVGALSEDRPYATLGTGNNCFWKVVPHGNWLFSIVNRKNCPDDRYCGALLSFDGLGDGKARVTIDHEDPVLWLIGGTQQKRIRSKYGCNASPPSPYCGKELGMGYEQYWMRRRKRAALFMMPRRASELTGQLMDSYGGYVWWLTENPRS